MAVQRWQTFFLTGIFSEPALLEKDLPPDFYELVRSMLTPDPKQRPLPKDLLGSAFFDPIEKRIHDAIVLIEEGARFNGGVAPDKTDAALAVVRHRLQQPKPTSNQP